ncbi:hypothetical protein APHAL10511_007514 [Amanita phalloides]|nr:hypothetical protein APHAL10511_007514 [Amanita phalloides]
MIRFDGLPAEVVQAMCTPMHLVLQPVLVPGTRIMTGALYLGSLTASNDADLLREHRISHLVQVLEAPWLPQPDKNGFHCYRIDILDHSAVDIKPHLDAVCNHIDKLLRDGESVLVHCQQGVSRSAAIVIAYLIRNQGMSYDSAYDFLKRRRACIKPNPGFVKALQEWEGVWRRPAITRRFTS